ECIAKCMCAPVEQLPLLPVKAICSPCFTCFPWVGTQLLMLSRQGGHSRKKGCHRDRSRRSSRRRNQTQYVRILTEPHSPQLRSYSSQWRTNLYRRDQEGQL